MAEIWFLHYLTNRLGSGPANRFYLKNGESYEETY
jgi:hypothetical protein